MDAGREGEISQNVLRQFDRPFLVECVDDGAAKALWEVGLAIEVFLVVSGALMRLPAAVDSMCNDFACYPFVIL